MFKKKKNRTKQEWKIWPTGKTVKIHTNHESCWGLSWLAHHGDLRSSQWRSLTNYIGRPSSELLRACSNTLSDVLSGMPYLSQKASFLTLLSWAIFMFLWIRLSFVHKTKALNSLFSNWHVKKLACFYELRFGRISLNKSLSDSVIET